jgi:hypothetical protein
MFVLLGSQYSYNSFFFNRITNIPLFTNVAESDTGLANGPSPRYKGSWDSIVGRMKWQPVGDGLHEVQLDWNPNATSYFPKVVSSSTPVSNTCKSSQPHTSLSPTMPVNRLEPSPKQLEAENNFSASEVRLQGSTRFHSKGGKKSGKQGSFSGNLSVKEKEKVFVEGQVGK